MTEIPKHITGIPKHMIEPAAHRPLRTAAWMNATLSMRYFLIACLLLAVLSCAVSIRSSIARSAKGIR